MNKTQQRRRMDLIGKRVRLVSHTDPYSKLHAGAEGTVMLVDDTGTVFIDWDTGEKLGLIEGEDRWEVLQ